MRKVFVLIQLIALVICAKGQETIRIMQYNLLNYGNNTGYCNTTNNNVNIKNGYIKTIFDEINPDILTVCEFGTSQTLPGSFLSSIINVDGVHSWKYCRGNNNAGSSLINCCFYDSDKFTLISHVSAQTYIRDIDVFTFAINSATRLGDTTKLSCIVAHLKAGSGGEDAGKRKIMAQGTMSYLEHFMGNENVLIMGDFNLYSSDEDAYQTFIDDSSYPDSYFVDPVGDAGVGDWNNNYQYRMYHTQSTNSSGNGCITGGGMDDRFDFILMSKTINEGYDNVFYVDDSYEAFGNDGEHFNSSINYPANTSVSPEAADALAGNSDHLPITMQLLVRNIVDIDENDSVIYFVLQPNPATRSTKMNLKMEKNGVIDVRIYDVVGHLVKEFSYSCEKGSNSIDISLDNLRNGLYLISVASDEYFCTRKLIVK